jgi:hypothetical protein
VILWPSRAMVVTAGSWAQVTPSTALTGEGNTWTVGLGTATVHLNNIICHQMSQMVWLALLSISYSGFSLSYPDPETGYCECLVRGCLQQLRVNGGILPRMQLRFFPFSEQPTK